MSVNLIASDNVVIWNSPCVIFLKSLIYFLFRWRGARWTRAGGATVTGRDCWTRWGCRGERGKIWKYTQYCPLGILKQLYILWVYVKRVPCWEHQKYVDKTRQTGFNLEPALVCVLHRQECKSGNMFISLLPERQQTIGGCFAFSIAVVCILCIDVR